MESPYGKSILNVSRPAVLRQYYGRVFDDDSSNQITKRYTYKLRFGNTSVRRHLTSFITKLFHINLNRISEYVTTLFRSYMNELGM